MGAIDTKGTARRVARADLVRYMDQHRWMYIYLRDLQQTRARMRSTERVRATASLVEDHMTTLRRTYQQIELRQATLGLHTAEGASYG